MFFGVIGLIAGSAEMGASVPLNSTNSYKKRNIEFVNIFPRIIPWTYRCPIHATLFFVIIRLLTHNIVNIVKFYESLKKYV